MKFIVITKTGKDEKTGKLTCRYRKGQVVSIPDTAKGKAMEKALIETLKVGKAYTNAEAKGAVAVKREKAHQSFTANDTAKTEELANVIAKAMAKAMVEAQAATTKPVSKQ